MAMQLALFCGSYGGVESAIQQRDSFGGRRRRGLQNPLQRTGTNPPLLLFYLLGHSAITAPLFKTSVEPQIGMDEARLNFLMPSPPQPPNSFPLAWKIIVSHLRYWCQGPFDKAGVRSTGQLLYHHRKRWWLALIFILWIDFEKPHIIWTDLAHQTSFLKGGGGWGEELWLASE